MSTEAKAGTMKLYMRIQLKLIFCISSLKSQYATLFQFLHSCWYFKMTAGQTIPLSWLTVLFIWVSLRQCAFTPFIKFDKNKSLRFKRRQQKEAVLLLLAILSLLPTHPPTLSLSHDKKGFLGSYAGISPLSMSRLIITDAVAWH